MRGIAASALAVIVIALVFVLFTVAVIARSPGCRARWQHPAPQVIEPDDGTGAGVQAAAQAPMRAAPGTIGPARRPITLKTDEFY